MYGKDLIKNNLAASKVTHGEVLLKKLPCTDAGEKQRKKILFYL